MAKCDCVCISREELEELRARAARCSEIPPKKKKSAPKKKTTAKKSAPRKTVPKAVPVAPMVAEPIRTIPVKQVAAPKTKAVVKSTSTKKATTKKTTAKKKTAVKPKAIKEPTSPKYKPKKKKTAPKKKAQTADYRIVREEPKTKAVTVSEPYRGKVLERRERKSLNVQMPTIKLPTKGLPKREFPTAKLKKAKEDRKNARTERLSRREDEDTSVAVRSFQRPTDNLKRYDAPKEIPQTTSTAVVPRRETAPKALPAPDDGKTITATEYTITEAEDCSQGSFFERQACKRRNRKNGFRS